MLPTTTLPKGTGISNLVSTLVKRSGDICMYERSDNVWEVFYVEIKPAFTLKGKSYPAREVYPSNEDFGDTAFSFNNLEHAEKYYATQLRFKALLDDVEAMGETVPEVG